MTKTKPTISPPRKRKYSGTPLTQKRLRGLPLKGPALDHGREKRRGETMVSKKRAATTIVKSRDIFNEILEGIEAMKAYRKGKITLRTFKIEQPPLPEVDAQLIRDTRERLNVSRRVFARQLRVNERTLEKWEQGRAKPNKQAATLILLTRKFPDTLKRLEQLAA
jgi:putative transcriptional regulator